jgi:hypothetical protein
MKNLQEATEKICELKGNLVALEALVTALLHSLPSDARAGLLRTFMVHAEVARTVLLHAPISEHTISAFEGEVRRISDMAGARAANDSAVVS